MCAWQSLVLMWSRLRPPPLPSPRRLRLSPCRTRQTIARTWRFRATQSIQGWVRKRRLRDVCWMTRMVRGIKKLQVVCWMTEDEKLLLDGEAEAAGECLNTIVFVRAPILLERRQPDPVVLARVHHQLGQAAGSDMSRAEGGRDGFLYRRSRWVGRARAHNHT